MEGCKCFKEVAQKHIGKQHAPIPCPWCYDTPGQMRRHLVKHCKFRNEHTVLEIEEILERLPSVKWEWLVEKVVSMKCLKDIAEKHSTSL